MFYDIIVHELLHVIGLGHEHNRPDRDHFVRIHFDNVMIGGREPERRNCWLEKRRACHDVLGAAHQFVKFSPQYSSMFSSTPYDYSSIMHYHAYAFSKDGASATVEPLDTRFLPLIGNAMDVSYYDLMKVANLYNCPRLANRGTAANQHS